MHANSSRILLVTLLAVSGLAHSAMAQSLADSDDDGVLDDMDNCI